MARPPRQPLHLVAAPFELADLVEMPLPAPVPRRKRPQPGDDLYGTVAVFLASRRVRPGRGRGLRDRRRAH